ncbi:MAG: AMP-binding protein, partial [Actinomycetota bacterium]|nr:AMP-binding protein [Actinomycetota bacterium]
MSLGWLFELMGTWPERTAIVWDERPTSYSQLLDRVEELSRFLDEQGVPRGRVVALQADFSPTTVALMLALIERAAILVPLGQSGLAGSANLMGIAEVETVVTVDERDECSIEHRDGRVENPLTRKLIEDGRPGLVLFTSGSTGTSKAALHDLAALLEKFRVQRHRLTVMTFLLLDHIGGINTLFYALSNGGTVVSIRSRDPEAVCAAVERHRVE